MWVKKIVFMNKIAYSIIKPASLITLLFFIDRAVKMYLINLQSSGIDIDFYIFPFLNIYLVWNTGIGFGLISIDASIYYHLLTALISIINIILIFLMIRSQGHQFYMFLTFL